jgi:hypothetical protein
MSPLSPVFFLLQLLCAIPVSGLQWTFCIFAGILSSIFVFKNIWPILLQSHVPEATARGAAGVLVAAQMVFAIACKLYFF